MSLQRLIGRLQQAGLDFDGEDLADILWLAQQIQLDDQPSEPIAPELPASEPRQPDPEPQKPRSPKPTKPVNSEPAAEATLPPQNPSQPSTPDRPEGLPFLAPAAPALRQVRQLEKALRPLARKVPSRTAYALDEAATVEQAADRDWWLPVLWPAPERWLDVALVVEQSPAIELWRSLIDDWQALLGRSGAFRDVRVWWLREASGQMAIAPRPDGPTSSPRQLIDPSGRRLILLMSDCTSALWRSELLQTVLKTWAASGPLSLVQFLPERLWRRTALVAGYGVQLSAELPGQASDRLVVSGLPVWEAVATEGSLRLPVVTIEPGPLARWARLVAATGEAQSAGVLFESGVVWRPRVATPDEQPDPEAIVRRFWAVASPLAKQLAGYLAAVPVSWDVLHLIQAALLPESNQVHAAEVFMGGLIERVGDRYEFREGVRSWLVGSMPRSQTEKVLDAVSNQIAERLGIAPRGFKALLFDCADLPEGAIGEVQAFARIARSTLLRMGGEFAALGDRLDPEVVGVTSPLPVDTADKGLKPLAPITSAVTQQTDAATTEAGSFPPLMEIAFEEGYLEAEEIPAEVFQEPVEVAEFAQQQMQSQELSRLDLHPEPPQVQTLPLEPFTFETATLSPDLKIERFTGEAQQVIERLPNGLTLEMVLIPGGTFLMGAPKEEPKSFDDERPQHRVTVPEFLIGKYPITQAQWRAIATLPKVNIDLNPKPAKFTKNDRGDRAENRPVEHVSWHEATEACDRLSQATGRPYSLPSEAQWEYACRAGATKPTPFCFGKTITPELANYNGDYTYANGPKGTYRQRTTAVGSFPANAWGLYDMHGNVWEWCADLWHSDYQGAPTDGSAWTASPARDSRLLRGGSWDYGPRYCRSAVRVNDSPDYRFDNLGFRVCCAVARTPEVGLVEE